jgi:nitrate/nitrite-specific signal transduction histidine kinase
MNRPPDASFPARISRSLTLGLGAVMLVVVLVGGTSLALAVRIFRNNEAVVDEYLHLQRLEQIHSLFDALVFELHQAEQNSVFDRTGHALFMHEDLVRQIDAAAGLHRGEVDANGERHQALLGDLRRLGDEARALTQRMAAGPARFTTADIEWLDRASHHVARWVEELSVLHRSRIERLLQSSQGLIGAIIVLYLAFILVAAALIGGASVAVSRGIAAPLREMARAARGMAEAHFDARIRVRFRNEIGQLAHAFNVMADRLQTRDRELRSARDDLEKKVQGAQALYRISTEIARLHQVDRILQSVVEKARELHRCDAAAICLFTPGQGDLVARATSGPPEAFVAEGDPPRCDPVPAEGYEARCLRCPLIRPDYARAYLAAPLQLGDDRIGTIYVAHREEREFAAADAELLAGLATQAALAIERARLSGELQSLATVAERERIAREMHDGLAQSLGLLHMKLSALGSATGPPAMADAIREVTQIAQLAYEEARQSIFGLRTFVSRGLGLVPTLTEYLHEFSAQNGIPVALEVAEGPLGPLSPASEVQAVRIIQEALTNVRKHAAAGRAWVRLQKDGPWLRVSVEDDGVGWNREASTSRDRLHFGLDTMRERAEGLGGTVEIDTAPGRGTRVVATLPREAA